jgi:hypothetical protein
MNKKDLLGRLDFGQRIAEEEGDALASYFVETDNWRRLFNGDIDIVYGPKGSGKSALYSLLVARTNDLFNRKILLAPAENPRGATAFGDLVADPPATEREFVGLWKLYFCTLLSATFDEYGIQGESAAQVRAALEREGLVKGKRTLQSVLRDAFDYVKRILRPQAFEGGVKVDPSTQLPTGFTGKIIFGEPTQKQKEQGQISVDNLLALANDALRTNDAYKVWVLLDRLDVAFVESQELEQHALRALFRVYLDMGGLDNIRVKIFLRTDIWNRITKGGFREASHITKHVTIDWDRNALLNLVVRRVLHNAALVDYYGVTRTDVLAAAANQQNFFYRVFPDQIDSGGNKPSTLDWMLSRTRDGTLKTAPRELIHLLNELRATQAKRFEVGQPEPDGQILFERPTFKEALPEVSKVRLTQTLYAEYPSVKDRLETLRGAKTLHTTDSLAAIWKLPRGDAQRQADELVEIGFFERRGAKDAPEYWVPFLYRDALDMVQGTAE